MLLTFLGLLITDIKLFFKIYKPVYLINQFIFPVLLSPHITRTKKAPPSMAELSLFQ